MAIRLRTVGGKRVALCAAEFSAQAGDAYLDDADHYALAAKFSLDHHDEKIDTEYAEEWTAMNRQPRNTDDPFPEEHRKLWKQVLL